MNRLAAADLATLHDAWLRLTQAEGERTAAVVALYHLCSELGLRDESHLTLVPQRD